MYRDVKPPSENVFLQNDAPVLVCLVDARLHASFRRAYKNKDAPVGHSMAYEYLTVQGQNRSEGHHYNTRN